MSQCNCGGCGCNVVIATNRYAQGYNYGYFNDWYAGQNCGCSNCNQCSNCCTCNSSNCSTEEALACPYGTQLTECIVYNGESFEDLDVFTSTPLNDVLEQILTLLGSTTTITADNGLRISSGSNVQLGGLTAPGEALLQNTYINADTFGLFITGTTTPSTGILNVSQTGAGNFQAIVATSIGGSAIKGTSTSNSGVLGVSTSGFGGSFQSTSSSGLEVLSAALTTTVATITGTPSSTNSLKTILTLTRNTSGSAANGIGGSLDFFTEASSSTALSNRISSKWSDSVFATRFSELEIYGVNLGVTTKILGIKGNGTPSMTLQAFDNQADAISGGLVAGEIYQTTGSGSAPLNIAGILVIVQ